MTDPILEISNLRSGYGSGDILQGVDIAVAHGEIVAVVGRNGVGKTTLMRTIIGLVQTRAGTIRFSGTDISASLPEDRARMGLGYVPQGKMIFSHLTVDENLLMGHRINTGKPKNRDLVFDYFPILGERLKQKGGTLSGGQQQALAIARALVGQPRILLLDEPSESIQPNIVIEIGDILTRLNRETGLTIILVEQHLGLIGATAQRGYVLDKGQTGNGLTQSDMKNRDVMINHLSV